MYTIYWAGTMRAFEEEIIILLVGSGLESIIVAPFTVDLP